MTKFTDKLKNILYVESLIQSIETIPLENIHCSSIRYQFERNLHATNLENIILSLNFGDTFFTIKRGSVNNIIAVDGINISSDNIEFKIDEDDDSDEVEDFLTHKQEYLEASNKIVMRKIQLKRLTDYFINSFDGSSIKAVEENADGFMQCSFDKEPIDPSILSSIQPISVCLREDGNYIEYKAYTGYFNDSFKISHLSVGYPENSIDINNVAIIADVETHLGESIYEKMVNGLEEFKKYYKMTDTLSI